MKGFGSCKTDMAIKLAYSKGKIVRNCEFRSVVLAKECFGRCQGRGIYKSSCMERKPQCTLNESDGL